MSERRPWNSEEDSALQHIFQNSRLTKWSYIARSLQEDHGFFNRTGKQCRERYFTHLDALNHKQEWNYTLESRLVQLHNQVGNKWAVIGQRMGGISDNSIKNHFYSLLRRAIRKLNSVMQREHMKELKQFKPPILYRIIEVADDRCRLMAQSDNRFSQFSHELKNQLLAFSFIDDTEEAAEVTANTRLAKQIIAKVAEFTSTYRKRGRKSRKGSGNNLLCTRKYEPKRINAEEEGSEVSQDQNQLDDIYMDGGPIQKMYRGRKQSLASVSNELIIEEEPSFGVRTRARSHGSFECSMIEKPNYSLEEKIVEQQPMVGVDEQENVFDHLGIQGIRQGIDLLTQEPSDMRKKDKVSVIEHSSQRRMDCQLHFFEDSWMDIRGLPVIELSAHIDDELFQ